MKSTEKYLQNLFDDLDILLTQVKLYKKITIKNTETQTILSVLEEQIEKINNHQQEIKKLIQNEDISNTGTININLSPRELEVLTLVAKGLANKQIAYQLNISERTVHFHLKSIFTKSNTTSRTEASVWALSKNIIKL
ncbi:MAG: response regulator transcription factor [Oligoflexia bacterium]|nr:response regulator transcription factor [Oligoflexia bacterium]